ncbi:hypothetical protein [Polaromonas sp. C04]|uniref:hypothetical protein n=1 Tax=Polaromonas sp. C04 TaxID=1945857 RepID=UPI001184D9CF|nr:hypothetical protein [Polaromonas sp. C04]
MPKKSPKPEDIKPPHWPHWQQRKYVRAWYAVLLSMNIEPSKKAREALKKADPARYQEYTERLAITRARVGIDIDYFPDHFSEGAKAGEKYIPLQDYYFFAKALDWSGLDPMQKGLGISSGKPKEFMPKQKNNYLMLMHELLRHTVDGFDSEHPQKSGALVEKWLKQKDATLPVEGRSIVSWIQEVGDVVRERKSAG